MPHFKSAAPAGIKQNTRSKSGMQNEAMYDPETSGLRGLHVHVGSSPNAAGPKRGVGKSVAVFAFSRSDQREERKGVSHLCAKSNQTKQDQLVKNEKGKGRAVPERGQNQNRCHGSIWLWLWLRLWLWLWTDSPSSGCLFSLPSHICRSGGINSHNISYLSPAFQQLIFSPENVGNSALTPARASWHTPPLPRSQLAIPNLAVCGQTVKGGQSSYASRRKLSLSPPSLSPSLPLSLLHSKWMWAASGCISGAPFSSVQYYTPDCRNGRGQELSSFFTSRRPCRI